MIGLRVFFALFMLGLILGGCGLNVKVTQLTGHDILENQYISFRPSDGKWYMTGRAWISQENGKVQWARIDNDSFKGATYEIEVETTPYVQGTYNDKFFVKNAKYYQVLRDEDMELNETDKEQGIGYVREWVNYVQGMKCSEGVFSRSQGGIMKDIRSKNYGISCGYYDKVEGRRLLSINYYYSYAGGSIRHQKDADVPQSDLMPLKQVELRLKQAVKQLMGTIKIKNMDRKRMEREGLMHHGKTYGISPY